MTAYTNRSATNKQRRLASKQARIADKVAKNRAARDRATVAEAISARQRVPNIREVIRIDRNPDGSIAAIVTELQEIKPAAGMGIPQSIRRLSQVAGFDEHAIKAAIYFRKVYLACHGGSAGQTFNPDRVDYTPDPELRWVIEHAKRVDEAQEFARLVRALGDDVHAVFWICCWPARGIKSFCERCRGAGVPITESLVIDGVRAALGRIGRKIPA